MNTSGTGTQSGTALAHDGLMAMRKLVVDAGGLEERMAWLRERMRRACSAGANASTGGGRFLWDDGHILGRPAAVTTHAPAGVLIGADWGEGSSRVSGGRASSSKSTRSRFSRLAGSKRGSSSNAMSCLRRRRRSRSQRACRDEARRYIEVRVTRRLLHGGIAREVGETLLVDGLTAGDLVASARAKLVDPSDVAIVIDAQREHAARVCRPSPRPFGAPQ